MFLQLNQITKIYNKNTVVNNLDLEVKKGELLCLLGPSGCGKTTTINMIGGFTMPSSGSIILDKTDITSMPPNERPTSTVFQSYALFPHMNVIKNVTYGLKFLKKTKKEALFEGEKMLEMVGLQQYRNQKVTRLSGGEQQRVALARALIMQPKVLLLDEPLSNLDAKLKIKMRTEIKNIHSNLNITMVYVTHDQEEALSISDKIVIMNKGKLIQADTPENIYFNPVNDFVADFIGRVNFIKNYKGENKIVRPENIQIGEGNNLPDKGIIVDKQFKGAYITYFIKYKDTIIQSDIKSSVNQNWKKGENVNLCIKSDL